MAKILVIKTQMSVSRIEIEEDVDGDESESVALGRAINSDAWENEPTTYTYEVHRTVGKDTIVKQFTRRG